MVHEVESILQESVYPILDRAKVLKDLDPLDDGNRYLMSCPKCGSRKARIFKTGVIIYCECGFFSDILAYTKHRFELTDSEALERLSLLTN